MGRCRCAFLPLMVALWGCATQRAVAEEAQRNASVSTAPPPQAAGVVRFAIIGDFGRDGPDEARVATMVHRWQPQFILTTGDDNYDDGAAETIDDNIGKHYGDFIRFDPSYRGPYRHQGSQEQRFFPTLGNHDWHAPGALPYLNYFDLPGNERYYRTQHDCVEIFALDSDPHEPDGVDANSKQAMWLKQALATSSAPWKLVTMHHPPHSSGEHGDNAWMQWPFAQWGATAVFAGHDHNYERLIINHFPYWVIGDSGTSLRLVKKLTQTPNDADVVYDRRHGAMLVDAGPSGIEFHFYNDESVLIDSYRMTP